MDTLSQKMVIHVSYNSVFFPLCIHLFNKKNSLENGWMSFKVMNVIISTSDYKCDMGDCLVTVQC